MSRKGILCAVALAILVGYANRVPILRFTAQAARWVGIPRPGVRTAEVSFPSGRLHLRGTLYTPSPGPGIYPAVVICHGGTRLGRRLALYALLAGNLAKRGYVVLTFDFRGFGESEDPRRYTTFADLDFVQDVTAAVTFLGTVRRVDTSRVSAVGHSFGAGVAVAAALRDVRIGAAVSISPGRNTRQRFFGPRAAEPDFPSRRMSRDMGIDPPIPPALFDPHLKDYVAEAILDYPVHPPVLLVDGGKEADEDLAFLRDVYDRMKAPKGYVTVRQADHYFGTGQDQDGSSGITPHDATVQAELANAVDAWLKTARTLLPSRKD